MKTMLLSTFFCLITVILMAQPTITSAHFVADGDILETRIDKEPSSSISPQGNNQQTWDYSALDYSGATTRDSFYAANIGTNSNLFPNAEVVQINGSIEQYYDVSTTEQNLIGYAGNDPVGLGIFVNAPYDQPNLYRSAPLNLFDNFSNTSSVSFAVPAENIPDTLLAKIPFSVDSVRVAIENNKNILADAYGEMTIPGGTYTVLRLNTTEYRETQVWVKVTITKAWANVTAFLGSVPGVGKDTLKHFDYYTDTEKEVVASVYVDNTTEEVSRVIYKANIISSVFDVNAPRPSLSAYPNPVENRVMFKLSNVPSGKYTIKIYNILGAAVWQKQYHIGPDELIWENLENLKKGTYLLSLINDKNITLSTQRLVIIKP